MKNDKSGKKLDLSPWRWSVVSDDKLAFWSQYIAPPGCPVEPQLYFNDDAKAIDELEYVPGELPGTGYIFEKGWKKVENFPVEFRLTHYFTKAYKPGDEKEILNLRDNPLKIEVSGLADKK